MTADDRHPDERTLRRFAAWDSTAQADAALVRHVENCEHCSRAVKQWRRGEALLAAFAMPADAHDEEPPGSIAVGLARLAVEAEPPTDLWEHIRARAHRGERAVLPMPDMPLAPEGTREVAGRDAESTLQPTDDTGGTDEGGNDG